MKKVLFFAAVAAMFAACSSEELAEQSAIQQDAKGTPVNFSIYTARNTRAGIAGTIDNANIKDASTDAGKAGFGVFAFYTAGEKYDVKATPNFMYNQQVKYTGTTVTGWEYEPVKYWPNEFGDKAKSDDIDYVTFFAYAPYTAVIPTTGEVDVTGIDADKLDNWQNKNIIKVTSNKDMGDPIIKYVVDTDPATSVDLLWGVAAASAATDYTSIAGGADAVTEGIPFLNLTKPADPVNSKININLKHALAKVKFTIDYVADKTLQDGAAPSESATIDSTQTRLFVRSFTIDGFALEGALNLNNKPTPGEPLWKAIDGVNDISFDEITFLDGRKDGKEGTTSGEAGSEKPVGLAKYLLENTAKNIPLQDSDADNIIDFKDQEKYPGICAFKNKKEFPLFECAAAATATTSTGTEFPGVDDAGYFYVIPRNTKGTSAQGVNVKLAYDVQTIDSNLADKLADNATLGSLIENVISKENIFGANVDFQAGKVYIINIHVGMTSVKIDASVTDWDDTTPAAQPNLPYNNVAP